MALAKAIARGDPANVTRLELGAHTGTHVDAPRHFIDGAPGADELGLDALIGPCVVADATAALEWIDAELVDALDLAEGTRRVLFKTRNSRLWERHDFSMEFVRLAASGGEALVHRGVRLVGIDYLSIGDAATHHVLLEHSVRVIEGLDLRAARPGAYLLVCMPLKIAGCDGAPARAVLWPLTS
jgi:arylformamidase